MISENDISLQEELVSAVFESFMGSIETVEILKARYLSEVEKLEQMRRKAIEEEIMGGDYTDYDEVK